MAVRIRVYPNNGMMGGMYGGNGMFGAVQIAQERADHVEDLADTQLDMERQLWDERIKRAQLQTAMKYLPNMGAGGFGGMPIPMPMAAPMMANPAMMGGMVPQGFGMPFGGMGGLGLGMGGQTNITTQTANTRGKPVNQSVANSNTLNHNVYSVGGMGHSPWGFGGFGGWLGGLLGGFF